MAPSKSEVWKYFTSKDTTSACCKQCGKVIKTSGNITNLKKHLHVHSVRLTSKSSLSQNNYIPTEKLKLKTMKTSLISPSSVQDETSISDTSSLTVSSTLSTIKSVDIPNVFSRMQSYDETGVKFSSISNVIIYFICADNRPINSLEQWWRTYDPRVRH
ncbi:hypothetical protein ABEB36_009540 [Hypothenemus hampei]|uniref:BED-type domain-containing protein n=1 Tax=Hypothenemus hampei TaxID=57062 RepID=A0ABD1EGP9_HYPHA